MVSKYHTIRYFQVSDFASRSNNAETVVNSIDGSTNGFCGEENCWISVQTASNVSPTMQMSCRFLGDGGAQPCEVVRHWLSVGAICPVSCGMVNGCEEEVILNCTLSVFGVDSAGEVALRCRKSSTHFRLGSCPAQNQDLVMQPQTPRSR